MDHISAILESEKLYFNVQKLSSHLELKFKKVICAPKVICATFQQICWINFLFMASLNSEMILQVFLMHFTQKSKKTMLVISNYFYRLIKLDQFDF